MSDEMNHYVVSGQLTDAFGRALGNFKAETVAVSEGKAKSNALYQAKKSMNLLAGSSLKWYKVKVTKI